ncbi:calmodulin-binding protein 60 [Tanacetum coccineum]
MKTKENRLPEWTVCRNDQDQQTTLQSLIIVKHRACSMGQKTLKYVGFPVPGDDNNDDSWTFDDFQEKIMSDKKRKGTLKGNTFLQLKEGVCLIGDIHFTHTSEHNKKGWYRLGAGIVDAALMNGVEVARTEAFSMKDGRSIYSEKRLHPRLSDKVSHLQQIGNKGTRYERLEKANVKTGGDMLHSSLPQIRHGSKMYSKNLKLKAASKIWADIVNNAQASNGMFLYLDQSKEPKAGVVLNAKLELKAFIEESHRLDSQLLVKLAIKHLKTLKYFEDETSIKRRGREEMEDLQFLQNYSFNFPTNQWHPNSAIFDPDVMTMAAQTVSITIGPRWRKVSKLLRRNSVRERFGIQAHKRQRCF